MPPSLTCSGKPEHPSKNSSLQLPESPPFPIQHSGRSRAPLLQLPVLLLASFLHLPSWKRQAISGFYPNSDLLQCSYHLELCWDSDLLENSCLSLKPQFQWMARSLFASALHQPGTPGSGCLLCGPRNEYQNPQWSNSIQPSPVICHHSSLRTGGWKQREEVGMLRSVPPPPVLAMVPAYYTSGRSLAC